MAAASASITTKELADDSVASDDSCSTDNSEDLDPNTSKLIALYLIKKKLSNIIDTLDSISSEDLTEERIYEISSDLWDVANDLCVANIFESGDDCVQDLLDFSEYLPKYAEYGEDSEYPLDWLNNCDNDIPSILSILETRFDELLYVSSYGSEDDLFSPETYLKVEKSGDRASLKLIKQYITMLSADEQEDFINEVEYASDTDSEDEGDYSYNEPYSIPATVKAEEVDSKPSTATTMGICHFRGVHFYRNQYTREQRKNALYIIKLQQHGISPLVGMFSPAAHELATMSFHVDETVMYSHSMLVEHLEERDLKLQTAAESVLAKMQKLHKPIPVEPCLMVKAESSRLIYQTRYHEFVQRYVNSYTTLLEDMKVARKHKAEDKRATDRTRLKWQLLNDFGFTLVPFVSTSEESHWGFEYAYALVNWGTTDVDSETDETKCRPLFPCYQADGHPRFPYLGIIYVTLHQPGELGTSTRILDLFTRNLIDVKCASPGGHATGGYIRARERIFIGGIDKKNVLYAAIVRVPNLFGKYRGFYEKKYGIKEADFNEWQRKINRYAKSNRQMIHSITKKIIEHVISFKKQQLKNIVALLCAKRGVEIMFLGINSTNVVDELPSIKDCIAYTYNRDAARHISTAARYRSPTATISSQVSPMLPCFGMLSASSLSTSRTCEVSGGVMRYETAAADVAEAKRAKARLTYR